MGERLQFSTPKRRVLVTGATGFVGSALVAILASTACHLRLVARNRQPLPDADDVEWVDGDVRDATLWSRAIQGIDVVFHLAGQTSVSRAEADLVADRQANVDPMIHLVEAARRNEGCPVVVFAGTDTQVGLPRTNHLGDDEPDLPSTAYDLHKLHAEQYLTWAVRRGWLRGASLRLTTIYGPGPRVSAPDRGVLNEMIRRALVGEPLTVYGDGHCKRDFLHVADAARAFWAAAESIERLDGGHFVVGSGSGLTLAEAFQRVADMVEREVGVRAPVVHVPVPDDCSPVDQRSALVDSRRFCAATGWAAHISFEEGLVETIRAVRRTWRSMSGNT